MDVRASSRLPVRAVGHALSRFNARHPWSHNDYFHGWICRRLPSRRGRALEVGCGAGLLAQRLGRLVDEVLAIDVDAAMVAATRHRTAGQPRVRACQARFADVGGTFDLITMVASLHHMPLEESLVHAKDLLRPGGRLLVVGLARVSSPADTVYDLASALLNPVVGLAKHPLPVRRDAPDDAMPVRDPELSVDEIASAARQILPRALVRRRLFFRYTLEWESPSDFGPNGAHEPAQD